MAMATTILMVRMELVAMEMGMKMGKAIKAKSKSSP
jgi:hypothetical protein